MDKPALLELFRVCSEPHCGSIIDQEDVLILTVGAAINVTTSCLQNNHQRTWSSSTTVGEGHKRQFVINILLAAYALFCGLNISQVRNIFISSLDLVGSDESVGLFKKKKGSFDPKYWID